jgi:hypothetical protein
MRLSVVQQIAGVLCFALVALIIAANLGCVPKYFQRADVLALLVIALLDGVLLLGASSGDSDMHRAIGVATSASAATLFLATVSIPVLFAPVAIAGAFRIPRSGRLRAIGLVAIPCAIVVTAAVVFLSEGLVTADQLRCP